MAPRYSSSERICMLTAPAVMPRALAARVNESSSATATNTRRLESGRRRKAALLFGFANFWWGVWGLASSTPGRRDMLSRRPGNNNAPANTFRKSPVRVRSTGVRGMPAARSLGGQSSGTNGWTQPSRACPSSRLIASAVRLALLDVLHRRFHRLGHALALDQAARVSREDRSPRHDVARAF